MIFPGQGAQEVGMGREFCELFPAAREVFRQADQILGYQLGRLVLEGPGDELTRTEHAQPAILVTSVAAVRGLEEAGHLDRAAFAASAGLSLGEYSALWFAGALSFADALRLVHRRGLAMQKASDLRPSGMVSLLGANRSTAERLCEEARGEGTLVVANLNAPGQIVVSGDRDACARLPGVAKAAGVRRVIPLNVAGAFHSPLMEPAREALVAVLAETEISDPRIPVYSNVTAKPVTKAAEVRALLAEQVVSPVLWEESMRRMVADGVLSFREPPPGQVLSTLLRKIAPGVDVQSLQPAA